MATAKSTFEEQLKELETVVERLERGELSLEENVSLFERGMFLSNACRKQLSDAESRVQVLLEPEAGGPVRVDDLMIAVEDDDHLGDAVEIESGDDEE